MNVLYKYRNIGDINKGIIDPYTLSLLTEGDIYFSDPKTFNDPFDCKFTFTIDGTDDELKENMRQKGQSEEWIAEIFRTMSRKQIYEEYFVTLNERIDLLKVFCLAEDCENTLMWSHYGQNHYGICVGIKVFDYGGWPNIKFRGNQLLTISSGYDSRYIPAFPINYTNKRPKQHNVLRDGSDDFNRFVLTKSMDWKYEKERRLIMPAPLLIKNPVKITLNKINEIIFGLRTPKLLIDKIVMLTKEIEGISFFKIYDNDKNFILEKREYLF